MILLNVYGKIDSIIISKKLGVGISNLPPDWKSELEDDIKEEILIHNHNLEVWEKDGIKINELRSYKLCELAKKFRWTRESTNEQENMHIITENLIGIQVFDFDNSYLKLKNDMMDSPSCEPEYPVKFIDFCCKIQRAFSAQSVLYSKIPFVTYISDNVNSKPLILNYLSGTIKVVDDIEKYKDDCVNAMRKIGSIIDDFLETDKDFWLFDYVVNAIFLDKSKNAYHIFKVMSLIEMLIINPNNNGRTVGELENKLPQFIKGIGIESSKKIIFATIVRKLRNKIAHGDFKAVQQLLEQYREVFMENYSYDEFEYSIENWTYLSICCELDEILSEILWKLITDKAGLLEIQMS